ncbi:MAG: DUF3368 domain-containing protein [Candidatus Poribacteria bacterium]
MIVISDSTPLILLSKINRIDILHLLFDYIVIPPLVHKEVFISINGKSDMHQILMPYWVMIDTIEDYKLVVDLKKKFRRISQADAEVIILAKEKQADFILSDDRELHKQAKLVLKKTDVLYTGAVLIFAKQEGIIDNVKDLLDEMREKGAWIGGNIYDSILLRAGEMEKTL